MKAKQQQYGSCGASPLGVYKEFTLSVADIVNTRAPAKPSRTAVPLREKPAINKFGIKFVPLSKG